MARPWALGVSLCRSRAAGDRSILLANSSWRPDTTDKKCAFSRVELGNIISPLGCQQQAGSSQPTHPASGLVLRQLQLHCASGGWGSDSPRSRY